MAFEHGIEIWYAILLSNIYIGKEQSDVILCIMDNGIAWSLGSRNVFYQKFLLTRSCMSRRAVSLEHLAKDAQVFDVIFAS